MEQVTGQSHAGPGVVSVAFIAIPMLPGYFPESCGRHGRIFVLVRILLGCRLFQGGRENGLIILCIVLLRVLTCLEAAVLGAGLGRGEVVKAKTVLTQALKARLLAAPENDVFIELRGGIDAFRPAMRVRWLVLDEIGAITILD